MPNSPFGVGSLGEQHQHAEAVPEAEAGQDKGSELAEKPHRLLPAGGCHPDRKYSLQLLPDAKKPASFLNPGFDQV